MNLKSFYGVLEVNCVDVKTLRLARPPLQPPGKS